MWTVLHDSQHAGNFAFHQLTCLGNLGCGRSKSRPAVPSTPSLQGQTPDENDDSESRKRICSCKKSRCLKLYCECFAAGDLCDGCKCVECANDGHHESQRLCAVENIKQRNSNAFAPKIVDEEQDKPVGAHARGCRCKKSHCLKKYCECFQCVPPLVAHDPMRLTSFFFLRVDVCFVAARRQGLGDPCRRASDSPKPATRVIRCSAGGELQRSLRLIAQSHRLAQKWCGVVCPHEPFFLCAAIDADVCTLAVLAGHKSSAQTSANVRTART